MNQESKKAELFGWNLQSWLQSASFDATEADALIVYCGHGSTTQGALANLQGQLLAWQEKVVNFDEGDLFVLAGQKGPIYLARPRPTTEAQKRDAGLLAPSPYGQARDLLGRIVSELRRSRVNSVRLRFHAAQQDEMKGALVGLEVGAYAYKAVTANKPVPPLPKLFLDVDQYIWKDAQGLGSGINIARHLVNTPPNLLYPSSFALQVAALLDRHEGVSAEIWDEERLKREGMGLHLAVGGASEKRPCLLHVRYRPQNTEKDAPVVLVGKGITFDCGGLDIKDQAGMRLMKKDMGGAAAVVGALHWLVSSGFKRAVDAYIPLAENAISGRSYRPGDIIKARNGMTVEIHNTDAEGRLVLADAMAVAGAQSDKPAAIIVAATLTGAIKIGLGSDVAGYFATDEELSQVISHQAQAYGDLMWRMPLFDGYRPRLETPVADINHCATGSYGGAITAALFLSEFAKGFPFAHMDIYAWADGERGALREPGGSGQAVQCLVGILQNYPR